MSDAYESKSEAKCEEFDLNTPHTIPPYVFQKPCVDANGHERQLVSWYHELETGRAEEEDANGCLDALSNALQISPYELNAKLACADDICNAIQSNSFELVGTPKGVRLSNWAVAYKSFLKEAQTCFLHYQLSNEGEGGGDACTGQTPPDVFEAWVVDVYAVNHVSVNSHGDDVTKSSNSIGLLHWYTELEFARLKANSDGGMEGDESDPFSDAREEARMSELERIAAMGSEHEHLLHTLITR
jgi:hypothetical protein